VKQGEAHDFYYALQIMKHIFQQLEAVTVMPAKEEA
jgi:hypothetical protein